MSLRASIRDTLSFGRLREYEPDHLRIKDVSVTALTDVREPATPTEISAYEPDYQNKYNTSIAKIDQNIYTIAAAVTALDNIECKLLQVKEHLEDLLNSGQPVDYDKIEDAIQYLAEQVNLTIEQLDEHCINLMRDSRISIHFSEIDGPDSAKAGIDLTLISLDKIMCYKVRKNGASLTDWIEFTENFARIVHSNVHIISSLMLALFASRDYTNEVTKFAFPQTALSHGSAPSVPAVSRVANDFDRYAQTSPTDDLANLDFKHSAIQAHDAHAGNSHQSLMDLLQDIREHAAV